MNIQAFIESGILEAYVLGQGTAEERAQVERMAAEHPEVRAELDSIEQALEKVAMANAIAPPDDLKDRVQQKIDQEVDIPLTSKPSFQTIRWLWPIAAMAVLAFGIATFYLLQQNSTLEEQISGLSAQLEDCQTQSQNQAKQQEFIALLRDRSTKTIVLSDGPEPKITATIWHNPDRRETALDINSLPAPEPGKYFQLWAIVDGNPVPQSLGMVSTENNWQSLPFLQNVKVFAISSEDNPQGNPTPTVVVMTGPA